MTISSGAHHMEYGIGIAGAVSVGLFGTWMGFDKERSFYPTVLIVIAAYYILFAVMSGSREALLGEAIPALAFVTTAALGFRRSPWIVAPGLALHGVFDLFHHAVLDNPGVPPWWPGWCLAYDVTAAVYLILLLRVRGTEKIGR